MTVNSIKFAVFATFCFVVVSATAAQAVDMASGDSSIKVVFNTDDQWHTIGKVVIRPTADGTCAVTASGDLNSFGQNVMYAVSKSKTNSANWAQAETGTANGTQSWAMTQTFTVKADKKYRFRVNARSFQSVNPTNEIQFKLTRIWAICS